MADAVQTEVAEFRAKEEEVSKLKSAMVSTVLQSHDILMTRLDCVVAGCVRWG